MRKAAANGFGPELIGQDAFFPCRRRVRDHADPLATRFDFEAIRNLFASGQFKLCCDPMYAVTGRLHTKCWCAG